MKMLTHDECAPIVLGVVVFFCLKRGYYKYMCKYINLIHVNNFFNFKFIIE